MNDTRERLLNAAEALYAARGVDAVSLREIIQEAGVRNATAVQYHFGDRAGIVRAILARHASDVEARRHALLDAYEDGEQGVRPLAAALVRPMAARLSDESGRAYLQIWADVVNRPNPLAPAAVRDDPAEAAAGGPSPQKRQDSLCRWRTLVEPLLEEDAARLHRRFTAILYASIELARRARSGPRTDDRLFTSYLIDVVTAILGAPVSPETRRLAAERDAARR
ncbi:TetR/AcrR family transcriptional regulator [Actinomadura sp. 7K507]|uniref:TetR/AcrR family transcriptional regulator n=1 Tax=Actinomadura sp. 7K507 TaxID=2530365 RepID=UPI00104326F0|nr:TetR/AcrR family transcriptional regulator [Actinomadura sp. 7K507]TDC78405.1 TetR/AcrR family transcriptional regulator [Actinomadura sp. 7K507]